MIEYENDTTPRLKCAKCGEFEELQLAALMFVYHDIETVSYDEATNTLTVDVFGDVDDECAVEEGQPGYTEQGTYLYCKQCGHMGTFPKDVSYNLI